MTIHNLYPTPIYSVLVENIEEINQEIDLIIDNIPKVSKEKWGYPHSLSTHSFKDDVIDEFSLRRLADSIDQNLKNYCAEINFDYRTYTRSSWFSFFDFGDYGQLHNHGTCDISGCYHYKTNSVDGDLYFETPSPAVKSSFCFEKKYAERMISKPYIGKLLIFPSWLDHGVMKNSTKNLRISIAFNITFNRD
jgi:uncharacterized protein (TIGR02466 family)